MNCKECNGKCEYDEKMGEQVCADCGFVMVQGMFEETVSNFDSDGNFTNEITRSLGSIIGGRSKLKRLQQPTNSHSKTIQYLLAISAEFSTTAKIRDEMVNNYMTLFRNHQFRGYNIDERVAAVVFFTFKENNRALKLKKIAEKCDAKPNRASKLARKISRHFGRPWVLSQIDFSGEIERIVKEMGKEQNFIWDCNKVHMYLSPICEGCNITRNASYIGAVIYITSVLRNEGLSQADVRKATNSYHSITRYREIKKRLNIEFKKWTVDEFVNGIYKEEKI